VSTSAGTASHSPALRIELVESLDALAVHADEWHRLLAAALPGRDFWYRLPMLRAMAPVHASGVRSPFLLLVWRAEQLVGALPLVLERKSWTRAGVRIARLWGGDGSALGVEGDVPVLGDSAEQSRIVRAMRDALRGPLRHRFDVLDLGYLRADSAALPALQREFADAEWTPENLTSHHLELTSSFQEYRAGRSSGRLRELGRLRRKLERAHETEFITTGTLPDRVRAECLDLHAARQRTLTARGYRRELVSSVPEQRAAIETLLASAEAAGIARHHLLRADGRLIAFLLTLVSPPITLAWLTSIDDEYTAFGPGGALFLHAVESEFERGEVRRIEYGPGTTFVKQTMGTHTLTPWHMRWVPSGSVLGRLRYLGWTSLVSFRARLSASAAE
jgi:CelD/BcsL family acetyltransferase involved in cellulose biosynthesis